MPKIKYTYYENLFGLEKNIDTFEDFLNLDLSDIVSKAEQKESTALSILYTDSENGKQISIIISKDDELAKKMDINFYSEKNNFDLFPNEHTHHYQLKDLIDNNLETTRFFEINEQKYFSFTTRGHASRLIDEFIEEFYDDKKTSLKHKQKANSYI